MPRARNPVRTTLETGNRAEYLKHVRSRIPLAYAGFLIVALVAVIGVAAFSAGAPDEPATPPDVSITAGVSASARVASAVFALAVTPTAAQPESSPGATTAPPTSTTAAPDSTTTVAPPPPAQESAVPEAPRADSTPPALRVTSPEDGDSVTDRIITFRGTTEPGASVTSGPFQAVVDDDGSWELQLVLAPGPNGAVFTAADAAGNATTVRMVVHYDAPTTTTTKAPATTTTTAGNVTTTTSPPTQWSPQWPADAGGKRDVEQWRPAVAAHWPADRVDCALGLIKRESRGDPRAHNTNSDAVGLLQHLLKYWKGRAAGAGFVDGNGLYASPFNGEANIAAGNYLASYYDSIGRDWWAPWSTLPSYGSCGE